MELRREFRLRSAKVAVETGDVTKVDADAIVNPANSLMVMGGGVAAAIKRKGGDEIEEEARAKAPVSVGKAVATSAGKLRAKWVIHAPTMERPAMRTTAERVYAAALAALKLANELGARSVAMPAMGAGAGRLEPREAARAIVGALEDSLSSAERIREVIFVVRSRALFDAFLDALSASPLAHQLYERAPRGRT